MRIDKFLIGLLLTSSQLNYGQSEWHSFTPSLSWKGENLGLHIVSQNVP